jgi:hypothetical protein
MVSKKATTFFLEFEGLGVMTYLWLLLCGIRGEKKVV